MPIGEFSGRSGLSAKRLRTYAATGLLTPAAVHPDTGYRYYSPAQLADAQLIDALRQSGMPLAEISRLLTDRGSVRLDGWAEDIRADAERRQAALAAALALLGPGGAPGTGTTGEAEGNAMAHLDCAGRTDIGLVRENNEDAIATGEKLVAVADGLGGHSGGEVASALAASVVAAGFSGRSADELAASVRSANRAVWERGSGAPELDGMATTICAAGLLDDGALAVAHVGDSRAYLARDGALRRLTEDHTVTAEMVRRGELTEAAALDHPHRAVLTRALGVRPDLEVGATYVPVAPGDLLLLCSDGLFRLVSDEELAAQLLAGRSPQATVDTLLELALARGGDDNVSVVVAEVRS